MDRAPNWFLRLLTRKVYRKGHIYGSDGSLYMGRWSLFETRWLSARVHHIARPDNDRHMHDHPWAFVSVVLRGWYMEARPSSIDRCFWSDSDKEMAMHSLRTPGSIAARLATDRHQIVEVSDGGAWTLFITGPLRQWWGFYTPAGKVHWRDYVGANQADPEQRRIEA